jgi:predicted ABC-class ATPase
MTRQVHQIRGQDGKRPKREDRQASGKCNFPFWDAIDPARHVRICGNPFETAVPAEVPK